MQLRNASYLISPLLAAMALYQLIIYILALNHCSNQENKNRKKYRGRTLLVSQDVSILIDNIIIYYIVPRFSALRSDPLSYRAGFAFMCPHVIFIECPNSAVSV